MATAAAASDDDDGFFSTQSNKRYALSGEIMLGAIIVLLFVVILMICLHLYVRLYLLSPSRRQSRRRRRRHPHFVFTAETRRAAPSRGLPQSVLKSLPVFVHSEKTDPDPDPIYCAVCLSEFEENEIGRTIPKCNHSFHVGCIDMWFYSHVTCPLCRSEVKPEHGSGSSNNPAEIAVEICELRSRAGEEEPDRGSPVELALSVGVDDESREVDDMSEHGTSRVTANFVKSLSLKRILCGDATERALEKEDMEAVGSER